MKPFVLCLGDKTAHFGLLVVQLLIYKSYPICKTLRDSRHASVVKSRLRCFVADYLTVPPSLPLYASPEGRDSDALLSSRAIVLSFESFSCGMSTRNTSSMRKSHIFDPFLPPLCHAPRALARLSQRALRDSRKLLSFDFESDAFAIICNVLHDPCSRLLCVVSRGIGRIVTRCFLVVSLPGRLCCILKVFPPLHVHAKYLTNIGYFRPPPPSVVSRTSSLTALRDSSHMTTTFV